MILLRLVILFALPLMLGACELLRAFADWQPGIGGG